MGITGTVGSYDTVYGGDPNRIDNVQLVAHLVDNKLIAPGATFSFNGTTGERWAEKGFLEAPVIVNGELQTGLGGGVCQVSTDPHRFTPRGTRKSPGPTFGPADRPPRSFAAAGRGGICRRPDPRAAPP